MKRKVVFWLLFAMIWIGVILLLSSRPAAESYGMSGTVASFLGKLVAPDFSTWSPAQQREWLKSINQLLRKTAHFFEFWLLGMLVSRGIYGLSLHFRRRRHIKKIRLALISFYPCLLIAALDELVQLSSAGRNSSPSDVLLDCVGIMIGIIMSLRRVKLPAQSRPRRRRRAG